MTTTAKTATTPKVPKTTKSARYWLFKTEPESFSFEDLVKSPGRTTFWDGVRNYQARNFLRDAKTGDGVLIYHSNADPPAIVGTARVVVEAAPDPTQFEPEHHHYDPRSRPEAPAWFGVEVKAVARLRRPLGLPELREIPGLEAMGVLRKGNRLSIQPVTEKEWKIVLGLGQPEEVK